MVTPNIIPLITTVVPKMSSEIEDCLILHLHIASQAIACTTGWATYTIASKLIPSRLSVVIILKVQGCQNYIIHVRYFENLFPIVKILHSMYITHTVKCEL